MSLAFAALSTAHTAILVFAVAPQALGGVCLREPAGPVREAWLQRLHALLPLGTAWRRMPAHIGDEALLGGLDLAATLTAGRPMAQAGLLTQAAGGIIVAAMAERIGPALASRLAAALDAGELAPAIVALDEGIDDDETPPASLLDRLGLHVQFDASDGQHVGWRAQGADGLGELVADEDELASIQRARAAWAQVLVSDQLVEALVATASGLGIDSFRAVGHALTVTRIAAALEGRDQAIEVDASVAARLVLAPRATRLPPSPAEPPSDTPEPPQDQAEKPPGDDESRDEQQANDDQPLDDRLIEAALAAIPPGLLAMLAAGKTQASRRGDAGRMGQTARSRQRGRPVGSLRGEPRGGARLALIDTLRAAAPWQKLRSGLAVPSSSPARGNAQERCNANPHPSRIHITREDLRIQRRVQHRATTTIFAIDASGSQAMHRLAEAKGAVELLLSDCYARRDRVAVIGFRGDAAQLLLAPTRSLVRAKRQLAGLLGGGGTPLADGIDAATALAASVRRGGATPLVVLLTDGRANIARGGKPGRPEATADALSAARAFRAAGTAALLIDTSPQPSEAARTLADTMSARCIALPHAAADALSTAVRHARGSTGPRRD